MCLYNIGTDSIYQQPQAVQHQFPTALLKTQDMQELLVQVKFFNGECDYSDAEILALSRVLQRAMGIDVRAVFETHILSRYPEMRSRYETSRLRRLLCG